MKMSLFKSSKNYLYLLMEQERRKYGITFTNEQISNKLSRYLRKSLERYNHARKMNHLKMTHSAPINAVIV
jgi:hypothetical protein